MRSKNKIKVLGLILGILFLSPMLGFGKFDFSKREVKKDESVELFLRSSSLATSDLTINWGDNLGQYQSYEFSGKVWLTEDPTKQWTGAILESTHLISGYSKNKTATIGSSLYSYTGNETETTISMNKGTYINQSNMGALDGEYGSFSSTDAGDYPATYTFGSESDGTSGTDISFVDETSSLSLGDSIQVISDHDLHKKVIEVVDDGDSSICNLTHRFEPIKEFSVEFWYYTNNTDYDTTFILYEGSTQMFNFSLNDTTYWYYYDEIYGPTRQSYLNNVNVTLNEWEHLKISVFDSNKISVFFNGFVMTYDPYNGTAPGVIMGDDVGIGSWWDFGAPPLFEDMTIGINALSILVDTKTIYIDAFGEEFDPEYKLGDNYYFTYYEIGEDFEDKSINDTFTGLESLGSYTVINDTEGVKYSYGGTFDPNRKNLAIRQDIAHQGVVGPQPDEVDFGFDNVTIDTIPTFFDDYSEGDPGSSSTMRVTGPGSSHNYGAPYDRKVLQMWLDDSSDSWYEPVWFRHNFSAQDYGSVEFNFEGTYWQAEFRDINGEVLFSFGKGSQYFKYNLTIWDNIGSKWGQYLIDSSTGVELVDLGINQDMDEIYIDFECTTGQYKGLDQYTARVVVNSMSYSEPFVFTKNASGVVSMTITTEPTSPGSSGGWNVNHYDDFSYSWSTGIGKIHPLWNASVIEMTFDNQTSGEIAYSSYNLDIFEDPDWSMYQFPHWFKIDFMQDDTIGFYIVIDWVLMVLCNSEVGGGLWDMSLLTFNPNTWYYSYIDFDCSTDTYDFSLDDGPLWTDLIFSNDVDHINKIRISVSRTRYNIYPSMDYFDGLSFSWEHTVLDYEDIADQLSAIELDFLLTTTLEGTSVDEILSMSIEIYFVTSIATEIDFNLWNEGYLQYDLINTTKTTSMVKVWYYNDTGDYLDYMNSDDQVKIWFTGINETGSFTMDIDYIVIQVVGKPSISVYQDFSLIGLWKYRYVVTGSTYTTNWTYFNVVEPISNIEMISEADYTTTWQFLEPGLEEVNKYTYWSSYNSSNLWYNDNSNETMIIVEEDIINDTYVFASYWGGWHGNDTNGIDAGIAQVQNYYINYPPEQWDLGEVYYQFDPTEMNTYDIDTLVTAEFRTYGQHLPVDEAPIYIYEIPEINMGTVTYNTKPTVDLDSPISDVIDNIFGFPASQPARLSFTSLPTTGWFGIIQPPHDTGYSAMSLVLNEYYDPSEDYSPSMYFEFDKIQQDGAHMLFQSGESETLAIRSPDYDWNFEEGDKIEVIFDTQSTNSLSLNLLDNEVEIKSYAMVESPNVNFDTQTVTFLIDEDIHVDQFEFEGMVEPLEQITINSLRIYGYNLTVTDVLQYYVEPKGSKQVVLNNLIEYDVAVYEKSTLKWTTNISVSNDLQVLIYEVTPLSTVYINYYDINSEHLNFFDFVTYVNYSVEGTPAINLRLADNLFYVDSGTTISFKVFDTSDVVVFSGDRGDALFIDIDLDVVSLKIKNEAAEYINYSLSNVLSSVEKTGNIFSGEIIEYMIATGNYILEYMNHEDNSYHSVPISLFNNEIEVIDTTYREVYFAIFSYDGLGLDHDLIRFYINGKRSDLGFNTMTQRNVSIIILDFFNNTLFNETIDTLGLLEYNMFVDVYTLNIVNLFVFDDLIVNITQQNSSIWMSQILPNEMSLPYRFLPNINYTIFIKFLNDTVYDEKVINLTTNGQIESFGVTEEYPEGVELPEYPKDVYIGVYEATGLGIDFNMVKLYINGTRTDFGFSTFGSDAMTNVTVKDYFDSILFTTMLNVTGIYEYNIEITLFTLKIKNEATEYANYTLAFGSHSTEGFILSEEIIEFQLSSQTYTFIYRNSENNQTLSTVIDLDDNKVFIIDSTYRDIYFSLYTYDGFGIDRDIIKFYINGSRREFGFNTIESEFCDLSIYDFFDNLLFNETVNCYNLTIPEYSIFIEIFTLSVVNLYKGEDLIIEISQEGFSSNISYVVSSQTNIPFRLVPNLEYTITAYDINRTLIEEQEIKLEDNNMVVDFGFYQAEVPIDPSPIAATFMVYFWFVIFLVGAFAIVTILYLRIRNTENDKVQKYPKVRKQKATTYKRNFVD
ncbi:MAG: LamG domain-containing protein [PVC group bacterium]|nr:LamG domain-containing protein [PVC group bacterium]